jgi:hypothetical protein
MMLESDSPLDFEARSVEIDNLYAGPPQYYPVFKEPVLGTF